MMEVSLGTAINRMRPLTTSAQVNIVRDEALPAILERLMKLESRVEDLEGLTESLQQQLTSESVSEPAGDAPEEVVTGG